MKRAAFAKVVPDDAFDVRMIGSAVIGYRTVRHADPATRRWTMDKHRIGEIEALIKHRHGTVVDTDDGVIYFEAAAPHLPEEARWAWARRWMPCMTEVEAASVLDAPMRWLKAMEIGEVLAVTSAERQALSLRSIRAAGQTDDDLADDRRQRRAAAAREKRAALPKRPKLKDEKPWEALGISRRTWFRREASGGTGSVANKKDQLIDHAKSATASGGAAPRPRAAQGKVVATNASGLAENLARLADTVASIRRAMIPVAAAASRLRVVIPPTVNPVERNGRNAA